jgi:hypothetical protein
MRSLRIICLLLLVGGYAVSAQDNSGNKAAPTQRPSATSARVHHPAKRARIERGAVSSSPLTSPSPSTNVAATKRSSEDRPSYAEAVQRYRHERHDRAWWHRHFTTIVLVGGGYYYWNAGYWCPAWGYNPAYEYYDYDGPIYTYGNLLPDQVIVNVQRALQQLGYYAGGLTGSLGSTTRAAIAAYQEDAGLDVTGVIDAAIVQSLGLN